MSIQTEINACVADGRLFHLPPALGNLPEKRYMFVSEEILDLVDYGPWSTTDWQGRCFKLRADLDAFTEGQPITACMFPFQARSAYMGRLHPVSKGLWDIRSRDPKPGLRVMGGFAATDVFIALTWSERLPLGDKDSREWRDFILCCEREWAKRFLAYQPVSGEDIHDFISEKVAVV